MSSAHADMYFRLGGVILRALHDRLSQIRTLPAPGGQEFQLAMVTEAEPHWGIWSFQFDVALPNNEGTVAIAAMQVGSGFDARRVTLPLPEEEHENEFLKEFPQAHADAYDHLLDAIEKLLVEQGFVHDMHRDFSIYTDYIPAHPSTHMSIDVINPQILTREIAQSCQKLLRQQSFPFAIRFSLEVDDEAYKGREESLLVRTDRIVEDWDAPRLKRELGSRFGWTD